MFASKNPKKIKPRICGAVIFRREIELDVVSLYWTPVALSRIGFGFVRYWISVLWDLGWNGSQLFRFDNTNLKSSPRLSQHLKEKKNRLRIYTESV